MLHVVSFKMKLNLLACIFTSIYGDSPRVRITEGELEGTTYTLSNNETVFAFRGIPYAAPPIGNNRFKEPQPPKSWNGTRSAKSNGNICVQIQYIPGGSSTKPIGDEDCLFLNVFTPKLPKKENCSDEELMPVLFYIPGGGFNVGSSGDADPDYLLQYLNYVHIALNYRLGCFGFFATSHPSVPGNNGLKDQVEALRWVQRNIRFFGGDPNKVTIYGHSAGGASVDYHMVSPLNKGLFRSAIASSGSVCLTWSLPKEIVETSYKLASKFNCTNKNVDLMMKCLRRIPANDICVEASPFLNKDGIYSVKYAPCVEPKCTKDAFITDDPCKLIKEGKVKDIPFMTSVVENEGSVSVFGIVTNNTALKQTNKNWNTTAPDLYYYDYLPSQVEKNKISSSIKEYYFGKPGLTNKTSKELFKSVGDRLFYVQIFNVTKAHSSAVTKNIFCYKFYYRGTESTSELFPNTNGKNYGACHGDDELYVLKSFNGSKKNKTDLEMAKLLSSSIIAFIKNGDPNNKYVAQWKPISKNGVMNCLAIYSPQNQRMEDIENRNVTRFWNNLLHYEYSKPDSC